MKIKLAPATLVLLALATFTSKVSTVLAQTPAPSGTVLTIAGNGLIDFSGDGGPATNAAIGRPSGPAIGPDGTLYFVDNRNYRLRAVSPASGWISTFAGNGSAGSTGNNGPATNASFSAVTTSLAVDRARQALYVADMGNMWVRKINLTNGLLTVFAGLGPGTGGFEGEGQPATNTEVDFPSYISVDGTGNVVFVEPNNGLVRVVNPVTGIISNLAGVFLSTGYSGDGGPARNASFFSPGFTAADHCGNVFIADNGAASDPHVRIRRVDAATGIIDTYAGGGTNIPGSGPATSMALGGVTALAASDSGILFIATGNQVFRVDLNGQLSPYAGNGTNGFGFGGDGGPALNARFGGIYGLLVAPGGGLVIADGLGCRVRYVVPDSVVLTNDNGQTAFYLPWVSALAGELTLTGDTNLGLVDLGSLTSAGGNVTISGNTSVTNVNLGSLNSAGGNVTVSGNTSATSVNLGSVTSAGGDVTISGNTSVTNVNLGSLTNATGNITVKSNAPNSTVVLSGSASLGGGTNSATLAVDGTIVLTNSTGLNVSSNVTLSGNATVSGNVTNNGTLSPGSSPGRIVINGTLRLGGSSALRMELGGYAPGSGYDFIGVSGGVTLAGNLSVSLLGDFLPQMTNGASFTLLTSGAPLTGAFANVASGSTLTTTEGYARFTVTYAGANTVQLSNLVIVDTDGDGLPDWWEDRFGLNKNSAADAALDADGDGASNLAEFLAGTNPTNAASYFHLVGASVTNQDVRVVWTTVGGHSYVVQTNGNLSAGNFTDLGPVISVPGANEGTTNFIHTGAATNPMNFYRVRLGP